MPVPDRILLYRITHYSNLEFILNNGLHCANSEVVDPDFINIGNQDIIGKRRRRNVPIDPGGEIHDYVPFYFCPRSPMLGSIHVGKSDFDGPQNEIIYLVTDFQHITENGCFYVFTDGHALQIISEFFNNPGDFGQLDWEVIQSNDWARREEDNDRMRRKMAEFLVWEEVPLEAIQGIAVVNRSMQQRIQQVVQKCGSNLPVKIKRGWYF